MKKLITLVLTILSLSSFGQDKNNYVYFNKFTEVFGTEYVIASIENLGKVFTTNSKYLLFINTKTGDTNQVNSIWQRWADNANQIADLLGSINPNWTTEDWSAMLMEHIELLSNNVTELLEHDYQAAIDGFDDIDLQAMEMADMMAEGIAIQFPD